MTKEQDITLIRRDTYSKPYTLTVNSAPFDLSDFTIKFTVKKNVNDNDDKAVIGPIELDAVDLAEGKAELNLTTSDTDVPLGIYYYDVQINNTDESIVKTTTKGKCEVTWDVTKETS